MLIEDLAREVHENAVKHGWWEMARNVYEIVALIHSEWSEALEEARAGRPLAYIAVETGSQRDPVTSIIPRNADGKYIAPWGSEYTGKPEGIAVELIDGCIRILDYMGYLSTEIQEPDGAKSTIESLYVDKPLADELSNVGVLIAFLHKLTSETISTYSNLCPGMVALASAMGLALRWISDHDIDPLKLLMEKHEYNKGRPYKHGKKF